MIDLYGMFSPNVLKVVIALEEAKVEYRIIHVDVMAGENLKPEFLALNPIGKVPVLVDHEGPSAGQPIFESGVILMYIAETYAPAMLPAAGPRRWNILKWLMAQMAYAGPMLGQVNHFQLIPSEHGGYAATRYRDQARIVYRSFDRRLSEASWLGGDAVSIADFAMYPWSAYLERHGFAPADHPHLIAWRKRLDDRPSVRRALARLLEASNLESAVEKPADKQAFDRFFGRSAPGPAVGFDEYVALGPMFTAQPMAERD